MLKKFSMRHFFYFPQTLYLCRMGGYGLCFLNKIHKTMIEKLYKKIYTNILESNN